VHRAPTFVLSAALCAQLAGPAFAQTRTIVVDPGHGGQDPGGVGNGMQEKNIVLDVSNRFMALLAGDTADGAGGGEWRALETRDDDTFVSLSGRAAFANAEGADRFMSIHSNAFTNTTANGTETFAFSEGGEGAALRNLVQEEMIAAWQLTNRGNKVADFAVLRETAMPAELHELAFITNVTDAAKLASPDERQKAAVAHLRAIQRHFGIAPYLPGSDTSPPSGELVGRVVDDLGPVEGASVALDTGGEVVTPADGSFVFAEVPAGARRLTVSAEGHEDQAVDLQIAAEQRNETEVVLVRVPSPPGGGSDDGADDGGDGGGDQAPDQDSGGCATGGPASGLPGGAALLVLLGAITRRRRR
jgi:MYXO-CTERM domain-containing protein